MYETTDQIFHRGMVAVGYGAPNRNIALSGIPVQQNIERGEQSHERRRPLGAVQRRHLAPASLTDARL